MNSIYRYEGCLLYFGFREQKQILVIENRFIIFQNLLIYLLQYNYKLYSTFIRAE